jgi:hypothetical protein
MRWMHVAIVESSWDPAGGFTPDLDILFSASGCTPRPICIRVTRVVGVGDLVQVVVFAGPSSRGDRDNHSRGTLNFASSSQVRKQHANVSRAPNHAHKRRVLKHRVEA